MEEGEDLSKIGKEHAIVVMNHKYDIDWLMGWIMADRHGVLGVNLRFPFECILLEFISFRAGVPSLGVNLSDSNST